MARMLKGTALNAVLKSLHFTLKVIVRNMKQLIWQENEGEIEEGSN